MSVHQLYRRLETIGKGAYGSVHKGEHIPTGNIVALKIINLDDKSGSDDVADIQREVALLSQLRDAPNVTKYYGCYMDGPRVWIVMEHAQGGSVLSLMKASRNGCLEEKYVSVIVREVLVGLAYLHKVPVIHRDIKAANILVTATGKVVICDFGVSALLATSSSKRNTLTGTPHWMAPELLQTLPVYDTKADIWSLGILIYEMIKGGPPHNTLENIKVMDLIPKAKPPRLQDNEAGKDLRDFMAMCLRENPAERLPADELSKTKWIRSIVKVSVSLLKDLVLRFEQTAKRASLAEPLDWEEDEQQDLLRQNVEDENPWEFDTVRGNPFRQTPHDEDTAPQTESFNEPAQSTIRPPQSSALPSSLRLLFEDDASPQQETLRPPVFPLPTQPNTPSPPGFIPASASSSPGRQRMTVKRAQTLDTAADELATKQKTFVYPPRGMGRSRSNLPSSVPNSDDENMPFDLKAAPSPRIRPSPSPDPSSLDLFGGVATQFTRDPRNPRLDRVSSEGDSLPSSEDDQGNEETSPATTVTPGIPSSTPEALPSNPPLMIRKRSKSTGEALGPRRNGRVDLDLASPSAFQFPLSPNPSLSSDYTPPSPHPQRLHSRLSPTHLSTSSPISSPAAHQTTFSLDTSSTRRAPAPNSALPISITRTRSATTLPDAPPPPADGPLLRKGTVKDATPLIPPSKPFALSGRSRSGSDASLSNNNPATPGLKDVLKIPSLTSEHHLGMSDLLPPSPSAAVYNARSFLPSPSSLSSSVMSNSADSHRQYSAFRDPTSSTPSFSLGLSRSQSPPPLRRFATEPLFSASVSERGSAHGRKTSLGSTATSTPLLGPALRPLDYSMLITGENTYSELARTIDDLTQWLTVVEVGLTGMLDKVYTDTIEEEQEVPSDFEDEQVTPGLRTQSRQATLPADT
ncbi:putative ste ste20 ysk protein kinase [Lyophyllum shimeji]|uniref:non-specific serine/threonine protein kinase n=1 Tax=Lyophyllum shimeji TaxID=47721 RepID=A0A9P3PJ55_LYOSH|nr:putative ste ste20 ysk protein kinase [Lyophyllum shimeji]